MHVVECEIEQLEKYHPAENTQVQFTRSTLKQLLEWISTVNVFEKISLLSGPQPDCSEHCFFSLLKGEVFSLLSTLKVQQKLQDEFAKKGHQLLDAFYLESTFAWRLLYKTRYLTFLNETDTKDLIHCISIDSDVCQNISMEHMQH